MRSGRIRTFTETVELKGLPLQRIKSHRYFVPITIATVLLTVACFHIWQRVVVINLVKEVSSLKQENRQLVNVARKLHSETAALTMSNRIEAFARDSLKLQSVSLDHLYTLVPGNSEPKTEDELSLLFSSIKRVGEYLPAVSEAQAEERDLRPIHIETDLTLEGGE